MKSMLEELKKLSDGIGRSLKLMEVCGTHTVEIFRHGIRDMLPGNITLLSGPGCPVCVTSVHDVDAAIAIARNPDVIVATFGDMMRVPGSTESMLEARSKGADVRVLYSPMDALDLAKLQQDREVVFFATGFETTSPLIAGTIAHAEEMGIRNFSVFVSHKLVPPALKALLNSPDVQVDGFILPGHVSTIIGRKPYEFVAKEYRKPSVITGFEAREIIEGIVMLLRQIAQKRAAIEIQYRTAVREEGNTRAVAMLDKYFEPADVHWRGIGVIPLSGLKLREAYASFDANRKFNLPVSTASEPDLCSCGDILRGVKVPTECVLFGAGCTPEAPVGPCMVSTEGSCAAYFKYGKY